MHTTHILSTLQPLYEREYGHSFTESLSQCCEAGVTQKQQLKHALLEIGTITLLFLVTGT